MGWYYQPHGFLMMPVLRAEVPLRAAVPRAIIMVLSVRLKREPAVGEPPNVFRLRLWDLSCAWSEPVTFSLTTFTVEWRLIAIITKYAMPNVIKNKPTYNSISISSMIGHEWGCRSCSVQFWETRWPCGGAHATIPCQMPLRFLHWMERTCI